MCKLRMLVVTVLIAVLLSGFSLAESGYVEQIIHKGKTTISHIIVTDWSKLKPLEGASEEELSIFRCMIAAQMLHAEMKIEDYLEHLNEQGILYDLTGPFNTEGSESIWKLVFSQRVSLCLLGDPITGAWISFETPFEVGGNADVPIDIHNTASSYIVASDDMKYFFEVEDGTITLTGPEGN